MAHQCIRLNRTHFAHILNEMPHGNETYMDNTGDIPFNETPEMLPPRGNLSEGGSTLEQGESLESMGLGDGVYTVNGGRGIAERQHSNQQGREEYPSGIGLQGHPSETQYQTPTAQPTYAGSGQQGYSPETARQFMYDQNQYPQFPYSQQAPGAGMWQQAGAHQQQASAQSSNPYAQNPYNPQFPMNYQQGMYSPQSFGFQQNAYAPSNPPAQQNYASTQGAQGNQNVDTYDYSNIEGSARIAIYDDLHSAPRVIQIPGGSTHEFIERIASLTYQHSQTAGGRIPYSVIREVSENFIHAQFKEVVVSILDSGNTIRFTDQGPGIKDKELVQKPGVTSATEAMKNYIRGVGSGLPLVKDALSFSHGTISIEDNVNSGTVVTISLMDKPATPGALAIEASEHKRKITKNDELILLALLKGPGGVSDVSRETELSVSSVHNSFERLTQAGLVCEQGKKRALTSEGELVARNRQ